MLERLSVVRCRLSVRPGAAVILSAAKDPWQIGRRSDARADALPAPASTILPQILRCAQDDRRWSAPRQLNFFARSTHLARSFSLGFSGVPGWMSSAGHFSAACTSSRKVPALASLMYACFSSL
jgi:hypothetical protein